MEEFGINELIHRMTIDRDDCYFLATSNRAELDFMIIKNGRQVSLEPGINVMPLVVVP